MNSVFFIVNPISLASTEVGPIGFDGVTGFAILGDGRLVATANADEGELRVAVLIEINPFTGQGTLIGQVGDDETDGECGRVPDITYDPVTGTLYGLARQCQGFNNNQFIQINTATGQGTIIGDTGFDQQGNGLARRADGVIFSASEEVLMTIDPDTGQGTQVASLNGVFPLISALAFQPETEVLFGSNRNPDGSMSTEQTDLETIDTTNGMQTTIGRLPDCTDALIFGDFPPRPIPTLSQWGLIAFALAIGAIGVFFVVKRRSKAAA